MYYTLYCTCSLYYIVYYIIVSCQKLKLEGTAESGVPAKDVIA